MALIGYARLSTLEQEAVLQLDALQARGASAPTPTTRAARSPSAGADGKRCARSGDWPRRSRRARVGLRGGRRPGLLRGRP